MRNNILFILLTLFTSVVAQCQEPPSQIRIAGSTTLFPGISSVSAAYTKKHANVKIENTQSSSTRGIEELLDSKVELARASRELHIKEQEKAFKQKKNIKMYHIAYDAICIVINQKKSSLVHSLSIEQIKKIFFTGEIKDWSQISSKTSGAINVYVRDEKDSGTGELFLEKIAGNKNVNYVKNIKKINSTPEIVPAIKNDPNGISYLPLALYKNELGKINVNIADSQAVSCNSENIKNHLYPISRKLYLLADIRSSIVIADFLKFVLSNDGQKILENTGLVGIK